MFYSTEKVVHDPCSTGLKPRQAAVLACVFGLVFILIETRSRFVRYCAVQSVFIWAVWLSSFVVFGVLSWLPFIGLLFSAALAAISLGAIAAVALLGYNAWHGTKIIVPQLAGICDDWSRVDP